MGEPGARSQRHSRRRFLQVAGTMGFTVVASGRGDYAAAQTPTVPESVSEAPFFEGQDLPPVAERIGQLPLVVQPIESIGQFGGTWRTALVGGGDTAWLTRTVSYDHLVSWAPDWSEVIPNVAHSFEASEDGRSYTFHLRPGMKWSDGAPFTSADCEFYVNSVYHNEALTPSLGDNPFNIEVRDDVTFTITFEEPDGFALQNMCTADGASWVRYPRHYLEQFHAEFNTENLDQMIADAGAANWVELFQMKGGGIPGTSYDARWSNPELPRINAWQLVEPYGEGTRVTFTRNPWYWKVDPDGQQLPYIDEVRFDVFESPEVLLLRASNGDIDMHSRHINTVANKPVLAENQERGNYELFDIESADMNTTMLALNLTHKDPAMREIMQNKDFRVGLSHAINRQEIIDVVYVGQGEPWQHAVRRETPWFNEELAKQYTEHDVDLANEHLDRVLPDKDENGTRLMSNGEPLNFVMELAPAFDPAWMDVCNLVVDSWQAVGVDVQLKPEDRSLMFTRKDANEHDCMVWYGSFGAQGAILSPRPYFPVSAGSHFAVAWYYWYQEPANAQAEPMEPPALVKEQMNLYDQITQTPDPAVQNELFSELLALSQEFFYTIGISLPAPEYGIKKVNLRNVLNSMPGAWLYPSPAPTRPEQYYYE